MIIKFNFNFEFILAVFNARWFVTSNCFQKLPYICEIDSGKDVIPSPSNSKTFIKYLKSQKC
jgi:hypothetical protein